jgi:hypothetical protein
MQLLGGLLEVNPGYVRSVESMGLAPMFFEFLSLEHSNNNVHNIRLCRQIIAGGSMPASELVALQVSEKVGTPLGSCAVRTVVEQGCILIDAWLQHGSGAVHASFAGLCQPDPHLPIAAGGSSAGVCHSELSGALP